MPSREDSQFRQEVPDQLKGAGFSPQPMIRRARSAMSLLCVSGRRGGMVPEQCDHCGPDAAGAHATLAGHWGRVGVPGQDTRRVTGSVNVLEPRLTGLFCWQTRHKTY